MNILRRVFDRGAIGGRSDEGFETGAAAPELGWGGLSPTEKVRLASRYLGLTEAEVGADALAETANWFEAIGRTQRLSLVNAFFALGGGDGAESRRRALWDEVIRILPGQSNSNIGEVSLLLELRDAEGFRQAGKAAGMREDWACVRRKYHAGASFSLREWGVRASLNVANDTAAARGAGERCGGGNIARAELDAYGPSLGLFGLIKHRFGRIDAQLARLELARRGFIPEPSGEPSMASNLPETGDSQT